MKKLILSVVVCLSAICIFAQDYRGDTRSQTPEEKLNEQYCTGLFKSTDGTILNVETDPAARASVNILNWLNGRVAGLQIYTTRMGLSIPIIRGSVPGIYVDEMPVSASFVNSLSATDIAIIKVIKTPFYGGFNGGGGAIAIYTIQGEEEVEEE